MKAKLRGNAAEGHQQPAFQNQRIASKKHKNTFDRFEKERSCFERINI
jgi:hypothetical protein